MHLSRTMADLEKANANTRQALVMSSDAARSGDAVKSREYDSAAESIATRLIELEKSVEDQKAMVLQATQAADQAKAAVQQNSVVLQRKLAERQKLLSQLDQAKMQEQLNKAMATLSESVGQDVPTFDEVRDKIEARYAKAKGMAELQETTVEGRMLEIEQASDSSEARGRLEQMRSELGIPAKTAGAIDATPDDTDGS
jgi:phage shock protein A